MRDDAISSASLDDLNKSSPLKPVYFELDMSDLSPVAQKALDENAALLKRYASWAVTVEGHCDERGTAEYNLALGERRAIAIVARQELEPQIAHLVLRSLAPRDARRRLLRIADVLRRVVERVFH